MLVNNSCLLWTVHSLTKFCRNIVVMYKFHWNYYSLIWQKPFVAVHLPKNMKNLTEKWQKVVLIKIKWDPFQRRVNWSQERVQLFNDPIFFQALYICGMCWLRSIAAQTFGYLRFSLFSSNVNREISLYLLLRLKRIMVRRRKNVWQVMPGLLIDQRFDDVTFWQIKFRCQPKMRKLTVLII